MDGTCNMRGQKCVQSFSRIMRKEDNSGDIFTHKGARGSVVIEALCYKAGRSQDRVPMRWIFFKFT
jgi:hypothetical protein